MIITIEATNLELEKSEKKWIKEHVNNLFSRVSSVVDSVKISISDANGPKGGVDKQCTVVINGKVSAPIVVKDKNLSTLQALRSALQRANQVLLRKWKRKKLSPKNARRTPVKTMLDSASPANDAELSAQASEFDDQDFLFTEEPTPLEDSRSI